jgi:hypothetical protein
LFSLGPSPGKNPPQKLNHTESVVFSTKWDCYASKNSPLSEIARVLVCLDHVARVIEYADHRMM